MDDKGRKIDEKDWRPTEKEGMLGENAVERGISNLGNTCFISSVLQAIFHISEFVDWFTWEQKLMHRNICKKICCIFCIDANLFDNWNLPQHAWEPMSPLLLRNNLLRFCQSFNEIGLLEDANEFLTYLLEAIGKDFPIKNIFNGK